MSKFTKELPDQLVFQYDNGKSLLCAMCKEPTRYYEDVGTDNPLCSNECLENWWKEMYNTPTLPDNQNKA